MQSLAASGVLQGFSSASTSRKFCNKNPVREILTSLKPTAKIPAGFSGAGISACLLCPRKIFSLVQRKASPGSLNSGVRALLSPPLRRTPGTYRDGRDGDGRSPFVPSSSARCPAARASSAAPCAATAVPRRQPRRQSVTRPAGPLRSGTVTSPSAPRTAGQPANGKR